MPAVGGSGSLITFTRTNATGLNQDIANETITFRLNGSTLEKVKASPAVTSAMVGNVSEFTVTRGAADDEIKIVITLSLGTGENVTLQSKTYPKNLNKDVTNTYKNFFQNWMEEVSS